MRVEVVHFMSQMGVTYNCLTPLTPAIYHSTKH